MQYKLNIADHLTCQNSEIFTGTLLKNPVLTVGVSELYPAIYLKPIRNGGCLERRKSNY